MQYDSRPISRRKPLRISHASHPELFVSTVRIRRAKKIAMNSSFKACAGKSSAEADHLVKINGPRNRTASVQLSSDLRATSHAREAGVFQAIAARIPAAKESARASIIGMIQWECSQSKYENKRSTGHTTSEPSKT